MIGPGRRDRLAVWTYVSDGEEVATGDPEVTDAERAAAGRETIAERARTLWEQNRRTAAARYRNGPRPEDGDVCRVWSERDPVDLRARVEQEELAVWAEDDVLHVLWRGHAQHVSLGGGVQPELWPVPDCDDLWEASLRIHGLEEALISIVVFAQQADELLLGRRPNAQGLWRGSAAPQASAEPVRLIGLIENHVISSVRLGADRSVTVYCPPDIAGRARPAGQVPACVLADGESLPGMAETLETAILSGHIPATLLVGVHSSADQMHSGLDGRAREYLPGHDRARFASHLGFVIDEVMPWAADQWGCPARSWVAAGYSNGAAWAIGAAQRRPDAFSAVAALSPGVVPTRISSASRRARIPHYLASGRLEPDFRRATRDYAHLLQRAQLPYRHHEWAGGHDYLWWEQQFPVAPGWLLRSQPG